MICIIIIFPTWAIIVWMVSSFLELMVSKLHQILRYVPMQKIISKNPWSKNEQLTLIPLTYLHIYAIIYTSMTFKISEIADCIYL